MNNENIIEINFNNIAVTLIDPPKPNPNSKATTSTVAIADIVIDELIVIKGFTVRAGEIRTAGGKQESITVRFPERFAGGGKATTVWINNRDLQERIKDAIWEEYANSAGNASAEVSE